MTTKIVVQIPGADKTYTYVCHEPVKVDDRVAVPGPPWAPDVEQAGTVVEVGSSYTGQLRVARVVPREHDAGWPPIDGDELRER
jgi:primosomal protein N'